MSNQTPIFEMIINEANNASNFAFAKPSETESARDWHADHQEGQLAVDVSETTKEIVVIAPMAGAEAGRIEVYIHNDLLTIRGYRQPPTAENEITNQFYNECFWGAFSRTIVLPVEVKADFSRAEYKNGVLIIRVPKQRTEARIEVTVVDE
jgi:HSP20 family protein